MEFGRSGKTCLKKTRVGLVISVVILCLFLMMLFVSYFVIKIFNKTETTYESEAFHEYQFMSYDSSTNEKSLGFTSIPRTLEPSEFITYYSDEGEVVSLISNFGETEYLCSGECSCEVTNSEHQRRSSSTFSYGNVVLKYLLVATSSILAYQIAEKIFENECEDRMNEVCEPSSIVSTLHDCGTDENEKLEKDWKENEEYDAQKIEGLESVKGKFLCKGYCLTNDELPNGVTKEDVRGLIPNEALHDDYCSSIRGIMYWDFDPEELSIDAEHVEIAKSSSMTVEDFVAANYAPILLDRICRDATHVKKMVEETNSKFRSNEDFKEISIPSEEFGNFDLCVGFRLTNQGKSFQKHVDTRCKRRG